MMVGDNPINQNPNPQDPQRRPRRVMARAKVFEQSIQNNDEKGFHSSFKRKVIPKSRRPSLPSATIKESGTNVVRDKTPVSPKGRDVRVNKLTVNESHIVSPKRGGGMSPRRQTIASTTTSVGFKTKPQIMSNEDDEVSLGSTEAETDSLDNTKHPQQSALPTLQMKGAATENAFNDIFNKQQYQLKRLEGMQRKREEESYRLEKIKERRRIKSIRSSLDNYDKTIEKNRQFGFDSACPEKPKPPQRRITDVEAAEAAEAAVAATGVDEHDVTETEAEEEEDLVPEGQAILVDQLQDPRDTALLKRRPSSESTLSPLIVDNQDEDDEQSGIDSSKEDLPVPRIITFVEDDGLDNSEITISSRIRPKHGKSNLLQKQGSSRWDSQPNNKKSTSLLDQDPICFRRPPPAVLKQQEDAGWAVHPKIVYGKPKTIKAVQPPAGRWAATGAGRRKKGGPQFPNNESRWAAQPKKKFPVNASRLPKRQATNDGAKGPVLKPRRQTTKENTLERAPRRGRRRSMIAQANEPRKEELKSKNESNLEDTNPNNKKENPLRAPVKDKLLSRNLSLGEVKRIVSATRIQSVVRMYKERCQYKMYLQKKLKEDIEKDTVLELQKIRDDLLLRQQSLRAASSFSSSSLSSASSPKSTSASSANNLNEDELRRKISEMESANSKLLSQCDRLRASNERMGGGNTTRDAALKEVRGRLSKLQHIQKKLNKVKEDFQKEYTTIEQGLHETNAKRRDNRVLFERTKACLRKIAPLVRSRLSNDLSKAASDLVDEVENMVPIDCLL